MVRKLHRVRIQKIEEIRTLLDEIRQDHIPRLIVGANGEPIAVLMDPDDYVEAAQAPHDQARKKNIMSFAGIWSDHDTDQMIADIHRWREEAPESPDPVSFFQDEREHDE